MPCIPQSCHETLRPHTPLPPSGSLLELPTPPVQTLHMLPAAWGGAAPDGLLVRLVNASDMMQTARNRLKPATFTRRRGMRPVRNQSRDRCRLMAAQSPSTFPRAAWLCLRILADMP